MAELTRRDRLMAAERLDAIAEELDRISTWLSVSDDHSRPEGWLSHR